MSSPTNTRFSVAYHALSLLASIPDEPVSSELLAVSVGSSPVYLRRVLGLLRRAGLVESRPGAVQGEEPVLGVHGPPPGCPVGGSVQARLAEVEQRVSHAIEAALAAQTVADTLPDGAPFGIEILAPPASAA